MRKSNIKYDGKSLIINGKRIILIGGEFHYFRVPEELWEERLQKIKQSGCNLVTTYIPWNFHEETKGKLNWQNNRNLPKFLTLCKNYGLYVIIKPGPYICAEWDFGGFPHWLLEKDILLRIPDKLYLDIVKQWFKKVAKIIKPFLITNGGNIVLIQIENEYDHLIEETKLVKNRKVAKEYLLTLLRFIRQEGIDIPAFTNEGSCILGTEIINTHTYYPNIPLIWMWEFQDFDRKIEESRKAQSDKPLMILELETGWFAQFGQPLYEVETELTEAITKTVIAYGASVLNYYMFVGGTSFPYWASRGDFNGIGICTTFDFGAAPIREWGEIHDKYHLIRNYAYFFNSFPEIIFDAETVKDNADFYKGGENVVRIYKNKTEILNSFKHTYENIKILMRKSSKYGIILIRNLEDENKKIQICFNSAIVKTKIIFPENKFKLNSHSSLLLPVDFYIDKDIQLIYSTSEIIARKKIDNVNYIILQGKKGIPGEMTLNCKCNIEPIAGKVKVKSFLTGFKKVLYSHSEIIIFKISNFNFIVLPENEAKKLWINNNIIMLSDFYYLKQVKERKNEILLNFQIKGGIHKLILWTYSKIKRIEIDNKKINFKRDKKSNQIEVKYIFNQKDNNQIYWLTPWKYYLDSYEKEVDYNDTHWKKIDSFTPLEKAKFFKHGYYWYRSEFNIDTDFLNVKIHISTNNMDRFSLYINGKFKWIGIGSPELDITELTVNGRNVIAICYENAYHTKAHPHEGQIKKMSGLFYPVKIMWDTGKNVMRSEIREWKLQEGLGGVSKGYYLEEFNDQEWIILPSAKKYVFEEDVGNIIWLRRWFYYKKEKDWEAPVYLEINKLKERCLIYINGFLLGKYENIGPQHRFYIPRNLLQEKNLLTLVIEGPGFHPVKQFGFLPPLFEELKLGFYYKAKDIKVKLKF